MSINILIVEDSATQARKLTRSLESSGFSVETTCDGAAGLAAVRSTRPDLVISDIVMPVMDGYEVCRRIKADEGLKETPVILLTSLSDPEDIIRGLECGADGFSVKTGSDTPVLEAIERLLRSRELGADTREGAGINVRFGGRDHRIAPRPRQIFDFLMSTYDAVYHGNAELQKARDKLALLNGQLEAKVKERTEELASKNQEISSAYQQLWHSAKLATLGELTASVAHELNNPLQTVSLRIESLTQRLSGDQGACESLSVVEKELDRMARLVQDLLQIGRKGEPVIAAVDAAEALEKTLGLLYYHLRKCGVVAKKDFQPGTPMIHVDPDQLQQAFLNLFTNACDAMPSGGTLTLRVHGGASVVIEIIDTGIGISPADLPRVMEIFFTTKPAGKGTGLGLPISRRIVEAHGGSLSIESEPGRGTAVRIIMPASGGDDS